MKRPRHNRKAFILVAVLWISAILIAIVAIVGRTARIENSLTRGTAEQIKMRWAARAVFENFIMLLDSDLTDDDGPTDDWYSTEESPSSYLDVNIDGFTVAVVVEDQCARLNINTIDSALLQKLPGMNEQKANCIIDWRDEDSQDSNGGAEDSYYLNLKPGYNAANRRFMFINELLAVKGFTQDDVFSPVDGFELPLADYLCCYSASSSGGSSLINVNNASQEELQLSVGLSEGQAKWVIEKRGQNQFRSVNDLLDDNAPRKPDSDNKRTQPIDVITFCQIVDSISVSDEPERAEGRVNINTAGREVLMVLLDNNTQLVQQIISGQQTGGFTSKSDILLNEFVDVRRYKQLSEKISVGSDVFTVTCTVTSQLSKNSFKAVAVISRANSPASILFYHE